MWRKLVQSTYRRKSVRRAEADPYLPTDNDRHVYFLGALAHLWGGIEDLLDHWVEDIHANGGSDKIQSQLPPNLDRELDYLSAALKIGMIPSDKCDLAAELVQQLHRIKGFRHTLIHGSLVEISADGRIVVDHSRVRGSRRIRARISFRPAQMTRHYEKAYNLERDLRMFLFGSDENVGET